MKGAKKTDVVNKDEKTAFKVKLALVLNTLSAVIGTLADIITVIVFLFGS